ncbi:MAG: phosphatase PAP2 family protein [Gaiellaceae bacterium]
MSRRNVAVAAAVAYAALAALVAAGALDRLDQWALDHAMPWARYTPGTPTVLDAIVPLRGANLATPSQAIAQLVTLPAAFTVSLVLGAVCCVVLQRRGEGRVAAALALAWVAGNGVEGICKSTLTRGALFQHGRHLAAYDSSFPSGHTIRGVLLAALVAAAWPRARAYAVAWAAASTALLELAGFHVPTDIAGGLLVAAVLLALVTTRASWPPASASAPALRASRASRPSSRER